MNRSQAGHGNKWNMEIPFTSLAETQYLFMFLFSLHNGRSWGPAYINNEGRAAVIPRTVENFHDYSFCYFQSDSSVFPHVAKTEIAIYSSKARRNVPSPPPVFFFFNFFIDIYANSKTKQSLKY